MVKKEKQKTALVLAKIKWKTKTVSIDKVTPTAVNYKIKTELGRERLQQSLKMFGLAGVVVCNAPNKKGEFNLIDGNSRRLEAIDAGEKTLEVSYPSRPLTPKEFKEMSAMFDYAKAGDVDIERIHKDLGTTKDFYERWKDEVPLHLLENMGAKANIKELQFPGKTKEVNGKVLPAEENDVRMVQLFFSVKQEEEFRKMEEKLAKKFKTDSTTLTVFKALKSIK